ncbi:MAG TPA: glycine-rich domain-containing protein-like [Candidatus Paceibacterota bacterium]
MRSNLALATPAGAAVIHDFAVLEGMDKIRSIDLSMVKLKLMDKEEGQGWDQEYADYVETRYRRYLCMVYVSRHGANVPTRDIDLFWHQHILDTRAYADDCQHVFGEFIHHFPYFGMRSEADAKNLLASFEETKALHLDLFGEPYCDDDCTTDASKCHKCGGGKCTRCGHGKCVTCKSKTS